MPRVMIDDREVTVPAGGTLLDAARGLGMGIPALCWRDGCRANTSCMVCLMKIRETGRLVPSCATLAEDGMQVESETEAVRQVRRAALELLLSDHAGECRAPCQYACPFDSDVPRMMRQIVSGRLAEAVATIRKEIPLAGVLTRVGREVCEGGCRRCAVDEAAAIGLLKRYVVDKDLASLAPQVPRCEPGSSKRVAIVGAGPAGLSAAYFLLLRGHACTLFEARDAPGGMLREMTEAQLPRAVLAAEIALIEKLGGRFEFNTPIGPGGVEALCGEYDAVLAAAGKLDAEGADRLGLASREGRLCSEGATRMTALPGVFAAGDAVRPRGQAAAAAADGKAAAFCIDRHLCGETVTGPVKLANLRLARPQPDEIAAMAAGASSAARVVPSGGPAAGLTDAEAVAEARRCLHCDCEKLHGCLLRKYAEMYGADASRYRGERRKTERLIPHPEIVYQPGKCIVCGLCVQIAEQAGERLGLTYVGRGFDVRVAVPFDEALADGLKLAALRCAEACPTGALALRAGVRIGSFRV